MTKLRVTAKRLNRRRFIPDKLPEPLGIADVVNKDFTFDGEQVPMNEVPNPALGLWYRDGGGLFYHGQWIQVITGKTLSVLPAQPINYASLFKNFGNEGRGIKVAILDNGFFAHDAFNNEVMIKHDLTDNNGTADDKRGHGTHVAGIVGARFQDALLPVVGVAPECELIVGKVLPDEGGTNDAKFIADGIKWAINQGVKIINLSLGVDDTDILVLKPAIELAAASNIIMIAAGGDVKQLDNNKVQYPAAAFDHCISVADVSRTYLSSNPQINSKINFLSGFSNYMSTTIPLHDFYEPRRGSSMATAFVSGLAARILSQFKSNGRDIAIITKEEIISELKKITIPKLNLNFLDFSDFKIALI